MTEAVTPAQEQRAGMGSVAQYLRSVLAQAEGPVSREHMNRVLDEVHETYTTHDYARRASYYAENVSIQDPVGIVRAENRAEALAFFTGTSDSGLSLQFDIVDRAIVHDTAVNRGVMRISAPGMRAAVLKLYTVFRFDAEGKICMVRTIFDEHCIGEE